MQFSIIIPVYNRPDEIDELLESLTLQNSTDFEVLVVEDGSKNTCKSICEKYNNQLQLSYFFKENEGPALTRNYGAKYAKGKWLIFFDSDCHLPNHYFTALTDFLDKNDVQVFGGSDRDHPSFTRIQKAISYAMTSFFTTGGIRGGKKSLENFKPRSFNMGIKKTAFEQVGGFGKMRFGEDIDLSLRLMEAGFKSALVEEAYVYHKRRTNYRQFFKQIYNSGMARVELSRLHPGSMKIVHLLPLAFLLGHFFVFFMSVFNSNLWGFLPQIFAFTILIDSLIRFKSISTAFHSLIASYVQLFSYGLGFIDGWWKNKILRKHAKGAFVEKFYE